ncbi:DNA protecting protein DprA [Bacteroidales bacterium Barb6XT]|nr:DNA protecting protein DprA [Bacteroidales bacterium Barb6XT]
METKGNIELLKLPKTAFLCSRKAPASAILKCYDWATAMREQNRCVVSGFHSLIEKDVLHFLLKGKQPVILVLGRAMYKQMPKEFIQPLSENRLLIVSVATELRQSEYTTDRRNRYIVNISEQVVFGYVNPQGKLYALYQKAKRTDKPLEILSE